MPNLDREDLRRRLYGNGAEAWEVEALMAEVDRLSEPRCDNRKCPNCDYLHDDE